MPSLSDLYQLGRQIEWDNSASLHELRRRDHAIGLACKAKDDVGRLLCWLRRLPDDGAKDESHHLAEASVAAVVRTLAFVLGFAGMTGFLLASGQGLVNVFVFLLLFVFLQLLFCGISAWIMFRSVGGSPPVILPVNPAKFLVSRVFPDQRFLRESQSVIRLLLLRYSQEVGAIFTVGAVLALLMIPLFRDFTYVWESDYQFLSGEWVKRFTDFLAAPWSWAFPDIGISAQAIEGSRYQPTAFGIGNARVVAVDGWRPFLIMSMFVYALFPRLALWGLSKHFYRKMMRYSLVSYPGSERVLMRMNSPVVSTQGETPGVVYDHNLVLVDWAGALGAASGEQFEEIQEVAPERIFEAGFGSLTDDASSGQLISKQRPRRVLVVVKAWEPPMADLHDFIFSLDGVERCTLCLLPLGGKPVSSASIDDWTVFSRSLELDFVDIIVLGSTRASKG